MHDGRTRQQLATDLSQYVSQPRPDQVVYHYRHGGNLFHASQYLNRLLFREMVQEQAAVNDIKSGICGLEDIGLLEMNLDAWLLGGRQSMRLISPIFRSAIFLSAVDRGLTNVPSRYKAFYLADKSSRDVDGYVTTTAAYVQDADGVPIVLLGDG